MMNTHNTTGPGRLAKSGASLIPNQVVAGSSPGPSTYVCGDLSWTNNYGHFPLSADSRSADVRFWRMYVR